MLLSDDPDLKKLGATMLKETRFYLENKKNVVGIGWPDITMKELVRDIETNPHKKHWNTAHFKILWNISKNRYDEQGN